MRPGGKVHGFKRKRDTDDPEDIVAKLRHKLHHGVSEVRRAAKKAKGMETQKSIKRLKGLRNKEPQSPDILQYEAELDYLKALDTDAFADVALYFKLNKDKFLSSNEHAIAATNSELPTKAVSSAKPGSPEARVDARLLSSKVIASEVAAVISSLRSIVDPQPKPQPRDDEAKTLTVFGGSSDSDGEGPEEGDLDSAAVDTETMGADDEAIDDGGWESGSVRSGGSSSEAEGDVSTDGLAGFTNLLPPKSKPPGTGAPTTKAPSGQTSSKPAKVSESTFLPSLSVGFTRGDSDSEPEDIDDAPRKNRRGQRARRAIWEKKFGKNANHVKKAREEKPRGPQHRPGAGPTRRREYQQGRGPSQPQQGNSVPEKGNVTHAPPANPKSEEKPLHPSWEAKKRLKEKQNPVILPPQGKKIVF